MITYASQQGAPWSGFNGFGGLGALADWTLNPITGVWTAPDGTGGWARNADGTFTGSVVDGLGNVIVYTVDADMAPYTTSTIAPGASDGLTTFVDTLSDVWARIARLFGPAPATGVTPLPTGSTSLLNPGTWSLPMILLIGGGVYWLASRSSRVRSRRARRNPWSMSAGGTGAHHGHGYSIRGDYGEFHVWAPTRKYGGYRLYFADTHGLLGGGLWRDMGSFRSPQAAKSAAKSFARDTLGRSVNPRRRSQARVVLRHLTAKEEMARYSPDQIRQALIRFGVSPSAARAAVARDR